MRVMSNFGLNFFSLVNLIFFIYKLIYIAFLKEYNSIFIFLLQSLKTFASISYPFFFYLSPLLLTFLVSSDSPCVSLSLVISVSISLSCSHLCVRVKLKVCSEIECLLFHDFWGKLHVNKSFGLVALPLPEELPYRPMLLCISSQCT